MQFLIDFLHILTHLDECLLDALLEYAEALASDDDVYQDARAA